MKRIRKTTILAVGLVSHFGAFLYIFNFITTTLPFLSFRNGKRIKFLVCSSLEAGKPNVSSHITGALENLSMSALGGMLDFFWGEIFGTAWEEHTGVWSRS